MSLKSIFQFSSNYRKFLNQWFDRPNAERGEKTRLSEHLNCNIAFISMVLSGKAQLGLEHAIQIADYYQWSNEERDYFVLLVQKDRAGSTALEKYFESKINEVLDQRNRVISNISPIDGKLSEAEEAKYYSHWIYSLIHMGVLIPKLQTKEQLLEYTGLSAKLISDSIDFLRIAGLIEEKNGKFVTGKKRIHLEETSPNINKHHINWRMRGITALDQYQKEHLHYTAVISLSVEAQKLIRAKILEFIKTLEEPIFKSKDETLVILNLDLFNPF